MKIIMYVYSAYFFLSSIIWMITDIEKCFSRFSASIILLGIGYLIDRVELLIKNKKQ